MQSYKKSQMAMFMLVAFVMFVVVIFVIAYVSQANRQSYQKKADKVAEALVSSATIKNYVDNCLSFSARDAFRELSLSGGFYKNLTPPGAKENINKDIQFINYSHEIDGIFRDAAYLLSKGPYDIPPQYPCPFFGTTCGGPGTSAEMDGVHYCNYSLSNKDQLETCSYGYKAPIIIDLLNNSIRRQMELMVAKNLANCINMSFFRDEFGFDSSDVKEEDISVDVVFGDDSITFTSDVPLVVSMSDAESVRTSESSFVIQSDFKKMFDSLFQGPRSALHVEWTDIFNNFKEYAESRFILNQLDYEIEHKVHERFKDDLFVIRHNTFTLDGKPYEFIFAIGNRMPVLSTINYAPERVDCEIEVPSGTNVTIEPEYADPDYYDELTLGFSYEGTDGWTRENTTIYKELEADDDGARINVTVSDGQYIDYQTLRICINESANLRYTPHVELLYSYEGFEEIYDYPLGEGMGYEPMQRISLEDPIKLIMGQGFSGEGTWTLGPGDHCERTVTSNCVTFPGWQPCDEDFNISIEDIKDYFIGCFEVGHNDVRFSPSDGEQNSVDVPLWVEECLPQRDESGRAGDNLYLQSNTCCKENFKYAGAGSFGVARPDQLFCGDPRDTPDSTTVFYSRSNDVFIKQSSSLCRDGRGNIFDDDDGFFAEVTNEISDDPDVKNGRRCLGCGVFGEMTSNTTIRYDYDERASFRDTFESNFLKEQDTAQHPFVCNPNFACVGALIDGPRGVYDISNYVGNSEKEKGIMKCQAACNRGTCDYAVNCVCTSECDTDINAACEGKEVGDFAGTCTADKFGQPWFPDVCGYDCTPRDIQEDIVFRCVSDSEDCNHCHPICNGKRPGELLEACSAEGVVSNPGVQLMCNSQGQPIDVESGGQRRCLSSSAMGCTASPECHNQVVGSIMMSDGGYARTSYGVPVFADMCDENCTVADSDVCWSTPQNSVSTQCSGRTPGEGFHSLGTPLVDDAFCNTYCEYFSCGNFAFKGGDECLEFPTVESCCYKESDNVPLEEKCNMVDPTQDDCRG